jgi:hypothetical protein
VRQRFADQGQEMPPRDQQRPEALAAYHRAGGRSWQDVAGRQRVAAQR